jgi:hypothetical protein
MPDFAPAYILPEDCTDRSLLKKAIFKSLSDSSYFHFRFKQVFVDAGFEVRHIERIECHPVWQVRLVRGAFELSRQSVEAARQIGRLLTANGLPVERNAISVILNGNRVTCSFVFADGAENVSI